MAVQRAAAGSGSASASAELAGEATDEAAGGASAAGAEADAEGAALEATLPDCLEWHATTTTTNMAAITGDKLARFICLEPEI